MRRERGGMRLGRVQSTARQPAGLTLQHAVLPSTSFFSHFSLSFASYLNTSQHSSLFSCSQFSFPLQLFSTPSQQYTDISLPPSNNSHKENTYQLCIPPFTQHLPSNPVPKLISLQLSAHHRSDLPFTCFLFFFFMSTVFTLSLGVSPMPLKKELANNHFHMVRHAAK